MRALRYVLLLPLLVLAVSAEEAPEKDAEKPAEAEKPKVYAIGDKVALLKHDSLSGGDAVDLAKALEASEKGIVLVWFSPICRPCRVAVSTFAKLTKTYTEKGWKVYGIFSGSSAGPKPAALPDAAAHKRAYEDLKMPFVVLDDCDQRYMVPFALKKTPTVAAIPKDGKLGFRGAPWSLTDQSTWLADYLDAVTDGKEAPTQPAASRTAWG